MNSPFRRFDKRRKGPEGASTKSQSAQKSRPPSPFHRVEASPDLKALSEFAATCEKCLYELRAQIPQLHSGAVDLQSLNSLAESFGRFSEGADGWGFDVLYRLAVEIQRLLLDLGSGVRVWHQGLGDILEDATELGCRLLTQCERQYEDKIQVANLLARLHQV